MKYALDLLLREQADVENKASQLNSEINDKNMMLAELSNKSVELQKAIQAVKMIRV